MPLRSPQLIHSPSPRLFWGPLLKSYVVLRVIRALSQSLRHNFSGNDGGLTPINSSFLVFGVTLCAPSLPMLSVHDCLNLLRPSVFVAEFVAINNITRPQVPCLLGLNVFAAIFLDGVLVVTVASRIRCRTSDFALILQLDKAVKSGNTRLLATRSCCQL